MLRLASFLAGCGRWIGGERRHARAAVSTQESAGRGPDPERTPSRSGRLGSEIASLSAKRGEARLPRPAGNDSTHGAVACSIVLSPEAIAASGGGPVRRACSAATHSVKFSRAGAETLVHWGSKSLGLSRLAPSALIARGRGNRVIERTAKALLLPRASRDYFKRKPATAKAWTAGLQRHG